MNKRERPRKDISLFNFGSEFEREYRRQENEERLNAEMDAMLARMADEPAFTPEEEAMFERMDEDLQRASDEWDLILQHQAEISEHVRKIREIMNRGKARVRT